MRSISNKHFFFLLRITKDMFHPLRYRISKNLHSQNLNEYYFLFEERQMENQKGGQKSIIFDERGIPLNPTYIDVKDKPFVYFPITIGQVGLAVYHTYLQTNLDDDRTHFLKFLNWFYENYEEDSNLGVRWLTDVSLPQYHNPGPWQSAFAQSRGISILLRGFQLTGERKYADCAEQALISFTKSVKKGGVTSITKWGPFYEEYTAETPTLVLNGMIFSLCGIFDFLRVFPEHITAYNIFHEGIATLEKILPEYDLGFWSRYNLCRAAWYPKIDPSTITYQNLHIIQLFMLYRLTGKKIFLHYALKFKSHIDFLNITRMYKIKFAALKKLKRI